MSPIGRAQRGAMDCVRTPSHGGCGCTLARRRIACPLAHSGRRDRATGCRDAQSWSAHADALEDLKNGWMYVMCMRIGACVCVRIRVCVCAVQGLVLW